MFLSCSGKKSKSPNSTLSASLVDTRKSTLHYLQYPKMSIFVWTFLIFCRICYSFVNAARIKVKREMFFEISVKFKLNQSMSFIDSFLTFYRTFVCAYIFLYICFSLVFLTSNQEANPNHGLFIFFSLFSFRIFDISKFSRTKKWKSEALRGSKTLIRFY